MAQDRTSIEQQAGHSPVSVQPPPSRLITWYDPKLTAMIGRWRWISWTNWLSMLWRSGGCEAGHRRPRINVSGGEGLAVYWHLACQVNWPSWAASASSNRAIQRSRNKSELICSNYIDKCSAGWWTDAGAQIAKSCLSSSTYKLPLGHVTKSCD